MSVTIINNKITSIVMLSFNLVMMTNISKHRVVSYTHVYVFLFSFLFVFIVVL